MKKLALSVIFTIILISVSTFNSYSQELNITRNGNVRSGPSTTNEIIGKVTSGMKVIQLGNDNDWYKVKLPDQRTGWIHEILIKNSSNFIISLEIEYSDFTTETRAEIFLVEGRKDILVFSFDCNNCYGEALMAGIGTGFKYLVWAPGAEHAYKGKKVDIGYKSSLNFMDMKTNDKGNIIASGNNGTVLIENKLSEWSIVGHPDDPLVFKVVKGEGYKYIHGSGRVISPDKKIHNLGKLKIE